MPAFLAIAAPSPVQLIFKALASCQLIDFPYRFFAYRLVARLGVRKQKEECYVTDRPRGYVSAYAVSRMVFKTYAMHGVYPGLKKFVW